LKSCNIKEYYKIKYFKRLFGKISKKNMLMLTTGDEKNTYCKFNLSETSKFSKIRRNLYNEEEPI